MLKLRDSINKKVELFDNEIRNASTDNVRVHVLRDKKRWLCRNDLYYLGLLTGHTKFIERFHRDLCDKVSLMNWNLVYKGVLPKHPDMLEISDVIDNPEDLHDERLFLLFRSAFKTTIITKLHTVQLLLNFPEIHIAISHNTQINASDNLESIKALFLSTELKKLFPEWVPSKSEWGNKTGFSVSNRKNFIMTGDNVEAIGIGTQVVGRKYHVFKNDDIVTDESVTNEEQIKKSRDYLELHKSLFLNPSLRIEDYSGTKYHFADAYSKLEADPQVEKHIIPLEKDGVCVLPEMFNEEGIKGLKEDSYIWNCQYQLNPTDPKKIKFTKDMISTYTHLPNGLNFYLVVDPADSEEKRACYTAMKVIGVDNDGDWWWADGVFDKIDDRQRIDEAIRLATTWRVFEVLWENLSFGRTDCRNFERASELLKREERTWGSVRAIGASRTSKDDRILGLNDRYSRKTVHWPPNLMYYSKFDGKNIDLVEKQRYEFLGFPLVSHKDLLDAESFMLQIDLIKGDKDRKPEPSRFAHIKDPNQRGSTEVFWRDFDIMKEKEMGKSCQPVEFEYI